MNLNEQVAKALGWTHSIHETQIPGKMEYRAANGITFVMPDFATDHPDFHTHVIPYMAKHNLMDDWAEALCEIIGTDDFVANDRKYGTDYNGVGLTHLATPKQMCEAFLKVVQDA